MPDYSKARIYTIRCKSDESLVYVGSTVQTLAERMGSHRSKSKKDKYNNRDIYKAVAGDWNNWYIVLYEDFPCERKEQLVKRENEIIREIGTLNMRHGTRTKHQWRADNVEEIKQYNKQYYEQNTEKIKQYNKQFNEQNADKIKQYQKEYRQRKKEEAQPIV